MAYAIEGAAEQDESRLRRSHAEDVPEAGRPTQPVRVGLPPPGRCEARVGLLLSEFAWIRSRPACQANRTSSRRLSSAAIRMMNQIPWTMIGSTDFSNDDPVSTSNLASEGPTRAI